MLHTSTLDIPTRNKDKKNSGTEELIKNASNIRSLMFKFYTLKVHLQFIFISCTVSGALCVTAPPAARSRMKTC